jgi:hypothetical protein
MSNDNKDNDKGQETGFKVQDKRRFDSSGEERTLNADASKSTPKEPQEQATHSSDTANFTISESTTTSEGEPVSFTSFIMSLATQVLVQLGEMPAPQGMEIPRDLEAARQTIDVMTMLQRRTKGNLSAEESHFMEEVLHSLRLSFINAKSR